MRTNNTRIQALRYAMVGLANTAITAIVIFSLMQAGIGVYSSNAAGYVAGILFSFMANSIFTFSTPLAISRLAKFLIASAVCWAINALAMKVFLITFPSYIYLAQLIGMGIYTVAGFFLNKLWVMK